MARENEGGECYKRCKRLRIRRKLCVTVFTLTSPLPTRNKEGRAALPRLINALGQQLCAALLLAFFLLFLMPFWQGGGGEASASLVGSQREVVLKCPLNERTSGEGL
jgi:hypothetical protein